MTQQRTPDGRFLPASRVTRTCENPGCSATWECSPYSWLRFCSPDCAYEDKRGTTHTPWKRGTSEELARRITTLLATDPHAWERFTRLMRGQR